MFSFLHPNWNISLVLWLVSIMNHRGKYITFPWWFSSYQLWWFYSCTFLYINSCTFNNFYQHFTFIQYFCTLLILFGFTGFTAYGKSLSWLPWHMLGFTILSTVHLPWDALRVTVFSKACLPKDARRVTTKKVKQYVLLITMLMVPWKYQMQNIHACQCWQIKNGLNFNFFHLSTSKGLGPKYYFGTNLARDGYYTRTC